MQTTTDILRGLLRSGLTQTEIARKTGIPQPRLSRWAAGEVPASVDDVLRLARLHEQVVDMGGKAAPAAVQTNSAV